MVIQESQVVNETLLELVKNVSAMGARLDSMEGYIKTLQVDVGDLKQLTAQAKALWIFIGLALGAGGTEAIQSFLGG